MRLLGRWALLWFLFRLLIMALLRLLLPLILVLLLGSLRLLGGPAAAFESWPGALGPAFLDGRLQLAFHLGLTGIGDA